MVDDNDDLDDVDRDALVRAMEIAARDPLRDEQLKSMLEDRDWRDVAEFAAYCVQGESLKLRPWQEPPCVVSEDNPGERDADAQALLRRMLEAGLSRYEPDPLQALADSKWRRSGSKGSP
jgi:hypothetical protein